ncbi:MAG: substrate-binding domain-containing protein [Pigmentiphaga sp.]|nr:substrate-binding domain-containing protein [Pigmentiphaga sp.]
MNRRRIIQGGVAAMLGMPLLSRVSWAASSPIRVGMLIPESGPAGLFGPSSRNCTELGVQDINARGGVLGRPIEVLYADGGLPPAQAAQAALRLWRGRKVEVLIGMHDSAVREAVAAMLDGKLPYIYTPTTEGGGCAPATYVIGETPQQQLLPVMPWLAQNRNVKKWYLIGNDYVWPRDSNVVAKEAIAASGGEVVGEEYLPFTVDNFDASLGRIRDSGAEGVFITLVGGASVGFNRAFASFGLPAKALRLCTLLEENTLLGIGAQNTEGLYSSTGYFATLPSGAARQFADRYRSTFDNAKAPLNGLAESCYEGLLLLEAMAAKAGSLEPKATEAVAEGLAYEGPRGRIELLGRYAAKNIYLAESKGTEFEIVQTFENVPPGQSCTN